MCEKCGGKGYYSEEIKEFDRATFRSVIENTKEFAENAITPYDKAETDTDAMLLIGQFLLTLLKTTERNLQTVMAFSVEQMDKDPKLMDMVFKRALQNAVSRDGNQN